MTTTQTEERTVLTVSQLNHQSRQLLEQNLATIWVEGEISNLSRPASGHAYFTLKDDRAQVRCAMFRNRQRLLRFRPENGMEVQLRAGVSLYEARGDYQLIVEWMEEGGIGALQRAFEQLKKSLEMEGLFALEHKRPLPPLPRKIGLITSPTGAAVHDLLTVLRRRFPPLAVRIYPTAVQGEGAIEGIVSALETACLEGECDLLILARGGGSMEDLWSFNEPAVARAIFHASLPVVSAVGHETDVTIADFVADHRAPTPSAAAELVSPDLQEWLQQLQQLGDRLQRAVRLHLQHCAIQLQHQQQRLRHPQERLHHVAQRLDDLEQQLFRLTQRQLLQQRQRVRQLHLRLQAMAPQRQIEHHRKQLQQTEHQLLLAVGNGINQCHQQLTGLSQTLDALSPLATLSRGYSITLDAHGIAITSSESITSGEIIETRLQQGKLQSRVI